jgi:hypothetical protein
VDGGARLGLPARHRRLLHPRDRRWSIDVRTRADEAIACVEGALPGRNVGAGRLVLGTDNGSQFTSGDCASWAGCRSTG